MKNNETEKDLENNFEKVDHSLTIEATLSKQKRDDCRNIIKEIKDFRVSQRQILFLIELLALELEDRQQMLTVIDAVKRSRVSITESSLVIPPDLSY